MEILGDLLPLAAGSRQIMLDIFFYRIVWKDAAGFEGIYPSSGLKDGAGILGKESWMGGWVAAWVGRRGGDGVALLRLRWRHRS